MVLHFINNINPITNNRIFNMKKAIIFYCIDNFNKEYKYVVTCEESKVKEIIKDNQRYCTEIYKYEICNAYEK